MTGLMVTAAPDFQDTGIFGLFAILAAKLAAFFRWTLACPMRAFSSRFSHEQTSCRSVSNGGYLLRGGIGDTMLGRIEGHVKTNTMSIQISAGALNARAVYLSKPESQCTMLSANCRLSMPGR
jgi:hypothetical protein